MKIRIIVATHKPYRMPENSPYLPLLVGAENNKPTWTGRRDNEGENISAKNPHYCELTGLYWAWKNLDADYVGLVHYRRHFSDGKPWKKKWDRIITEDELKEHLRQADILLPKPRHYWIETNYSQYVHAHHAEDLEQTSKILREKYPDYVPAFEKSMRKRSGHRFNMMVMKKELLDQYCAWLFDVLQELENALDISGYNKNDQRVFGFVGERLLDVWLETNRLTYKNIPYVFMEKQGWIGKVLRFIGRKIQAEKTEK